MTDSNPSSTSSHTVPSIPSASPKQDPPVTSTLASSNKPHTQSNGGGTAAAPLQKAPDGGKPASSADATVPASTTQAAASASVPAFPPARRRRSFSIDSTGSVDEFGRMKRRKKATKPVAPASSGGSGGEIFGVFADADGDERSDGEQPARGRSRSTGRGGAGGRSGARRRRGSVCSTCGGSLSSSGSRDGDYRGGRRSGSPRGGRRRGGFSRSRTRSRTRSRSADREEPEFSPRTVHVGDLSMDATRDEIRRHFGEAGTVVDVKMLWNKPFCFVRFATESAMERALKTLNGSVLRGSAVRVTRARNPRYRPPMPAFSFAPFAAGPGSMFPPFMDPFYDHDAVGDGPDDGGFVGPDDDEDGYMDGAGGPVDFVDPTSMGSMLWNPSMAGTGVVHKEKGKAEDAEDEERVKVVLVARSKAAVPAEELEEGEVSDEEAIVLCL